MDIKGCKKGRKHMTTNEERENDKEDEQQQQDHTTTAESVLSFGILELPIHLIYDILSRNSPKTILCCRCVCKTFLKILTDPYFAEIYLIKAPNVAASLILQDSSIPNGFVFVYMLDLEVTSSAASCSTHHHPSRPCQGLTVKNTKFQFYHGHVTLVGSCNGLLCLRRDSWSKPLYYICNPILGELMVLPLQSPSKPVYLKLENSGFGFCPKTKQYKVIRFMCLTSFDSTISKKAVAEIHTLGTESWRSIGDAPCPRMRGSFDSLLDGILHWITDSVTAFNLICSFDLETEQFRSIAAPTHFNADYVNKISCINVGVLGGYLCLCYVLGDAQFDVWVMKDYGVKESWTKEFTIDINFYCGLRVKDLHQPIKFLNNGDMLLITNSNSLVSYSPRKRTFREFKALGDPNLQAVAHIPSFISLKDLARGKNVKKVKRKSKERFVWTREFRLLECAP
ncbi:hypothetical protein ACSBR2_018561 [Camellia fascicularis]